MKNILIILLGITFMLPCACQPKEKVSFNEDAFLEYLYQMDSSYTAYSKNLPEGSENTREEIDEAVDKTMSAFQKGDFATAREESSILIQKSTVDSAAIVWNTFMGTCQERDFKGAFDMFVDNEGDFMVHLRHSEFRSDFILTIARTLIFEFLPEKEAFNKYVDLLKLEYYMELGTWQMGEDTEYCPSSLPHVIWELGHCLAHLSRTKEAMEMTQDFVGSLYQISGDYMFSIFKLASYMADIHSISGDYDEAKLDYETYLQGLDNLTPDLASEDEIQYFRDLATEALKDIPNN